MRSGQVVQFPLAQGISEDGNPKAQPIATLTRGVNIRHPKAGVIGKRFGTRTMLGMGGGGAGTRFVVRGNELGVVLFGTIAIWDPIAGLWTSSSNLDQRRVSYVHLDWSTLTDTTAGIASADINVSADVLVHAWSTGDPTLGAEAVPVPPGSGVGWVQMLNWRTGELLMPPTRLSVAANKQVLWVRTLILGSYAVIVYASTEGKIFAQAFNLVSYAASGGAQTLVSDPIASPYYGRFDAFTLQSGDVAFAYENSSARLILKRFTAASGVLTSAATVTIDATNFTFKAIALAEDSFNSKLFILYNCITGISTNSVRAAVVNNSSLASIVGVTLIQDNFTASQVALFYTGLVGLVAVWGGVNNALALTQEPELNTAQLNTGTLAISTGTQRRSTLMQLLSKPLAFSGFGGDVFIFARETGQASAFFPSTIAVDLLQAPSISTYLLRIDVQNVAGTPPLHLAGKIDHGIGGAILDGLAPQAVAIDTDGGQTFAAAIPFQASAAPNSFDWRNGLRLVRASANSLAWADPYRSVCIDQEAYLGMGILNAWDGHTGFDAGMRVPLFLPSSFSNSNAGHMANGSYVYQMTASYRSHAGVLHRSAVSGAATIALTTANGAAGSVGVVIIAPSVDCKQSSATGYGDNAARNVSIDLFRTEVNGSVTYALTDEPRYNVIRNDPTSAILSLTDIAADNSINASGAASPLVPDVALSSRPQPYSVGELDEVQPPAPWTLLLHNNRVFVVTGGRREIWYSKDVTENPGIAPGFAPEQVEIYEQDITGLASLDSYRIVFHELGAWYVTGDGPDVQGLNNTFSSPIRIATDVGCTNPRSIVTTPLGVFFQHEDRIYLLGRDLTVTWISRSAMDTLSAHPQITSAVLVASQNEVRFTCCDEGMNIGLVLVFDYVRGTWSTRTYGLTSPGTAIIDAVMWNGVYVMIDYENARYEDTSTHLDTGPHEDGGVIVDFVPSTVELSSLTPAGPIGWNRVREVRVLGESLSNCGLTVEIGRDFSGVYEQSSTFPAGSDVTLPTSHARCEVAVEVTRRQSIELRLTDSAPANAAVYPLGNGAGFQFEGVALLVQPKQGFPKDTTTRRGG